MSGAGWWLVMIMARALDPVERPVVLGDLAESRETLPSALWGLLGLIVRRQASLWTIWRPWLALLGISGVVGAQLSGIAFRLDLDLHQQWMAYHKYRAHFDTGLTAQQDFVFLGCLLGALILWSWTSGLMLGSLSGRGAWLTWSVFYLAVLNAVWIAFVLSRMRSRQFPPGFWRTILLPLRVTAILILVPALYGVFQGVRGRAPKASYRYMLAGASVAFTLFAIWTASWYGRAHELWSLGVWRGDHPPSLFPYLLLGWPAIWLLAMTNRRNLNHGENT